jgi:hypothetical protein
MINRNRSNPEQAFSNVENGKPDIDRDVFDLEEASDRPMAGKYRPKFLAKGGENVVSHVGGHPDVVVKVDVDMLKHIQTYNAERGQRLDAMSSELLAHVKEKIRFNRRRFQNLRELFGSEHVAAMKQVFLKVPVTERCSPRFMVPLARPGPMKCVKRGQS